jgi:predicted nuclease of predicted toxin-antitoxin system
MKFLLDAQISFKVAKYFSKKGFDIVHVIELPQKDRTPDSEVIQFAENQNRIIITKDKDFIYSYIVSGKPKKLLFVSTGNLNNNELLSLLDNNFDIIVKHFNTFSFIELNSEQIVLHE